MTAPLLAKAWTITPNIRNSYTSLSDMAGWWFYNNHVAIKAKWTLVWTCDGTTGPTNSADHTDRLTDKTKCTTQGATGAAAQSYAVYSNADGVQLKITNQGATADVLKISYSRAAGFTLAATTTNEPTATDETSVTTQSMVGTGTTLDRVMSIWVRDDGRAWSCACFRSSAIQSIVGCEQVTSLATVRATNPIFDVPYCIYRFTTGSRGTAGGGPTGGHNGTLSTSQGAYIRCYTDSARSIGVGGGDVGMTQGGSSAAGLAATTNADKPAAQDSSASPMLPVYWWGAKAANTDGLFASPIDWYLALASTTATPAAADPFSGYDPGDDTSAAPRANWWVALGSGMIRPWRNAAVAMSIS